VHLLGEEVGELALALVAPLGSDHDGRRHVALLVSNRGRTRLAPAGRRAVTAPAGRCGSRGSPYGRSCHARGAELPDDVLVHCLTPYDSTAQPMHLVLSIGSLGACAGCPPRPPELEMQVDWVRVWQRT